MQRIADTLEARAAALGKAALLPLVEKEFVDKRRGAIPAAQRQFPAALRDHARRARRGPRAGKRRREP
eukprot:5177735-Pyramimonas_sp.AAC.1